MYVCMYVYMYVCMSVCMTGSYVFDRAEQEAAYIKTLTKAQLLSFFDK